MLPWTLYSRGYKKDRAAPLCVFLHGWMGSHSDWEPIVSQMPIEMSYLLLDLPGHGKSVPIPPQESLDFDNLADSLHEHLQEYQRYTLVGYSMGGRLALYYTLKYPHAVDSLILESCQPGIQEPEARLSRATLDTQRAEQIVEAGLSQFVEHWYKAPLFRSLHQQPNQLKQLQRRREQNHESSMARTIRELSPGRQPSLWNHLSSLSAPTLLLTGKQDPKYPTLMQLMHKQIPHSHLKIEPHAGHNVHLETPEAWQRIVCDFLTFSLPT